jgi:hypothetical protein
MELTILMPCLNEALTVETCIREARSYWGKRSIADEGLEADHEEIHPLDKGHAQGAIIGQSQLLSNAGIPSTEWTAEPKGMRRDYR